MTSQTEIEVSRFRSDEPGRVTDDALQAWHRDGLLVIEEFASLDQCRELILAADALVEDFDEEEAAAIFSTPNSETQSTRADGSVSSGTTTEMFLTFQMTIIPRMHSPITPLNVFENSQSRIARFFCMSVTLHRTTRCMPSRRTFKNM